MANMSDARTSEDICSALSSVIRNCPLSVTKTAPYRHEN